MSVKVLHVTQATGGVETSLLLLFKHLDRERFELHLACPPSTTLAEEARALGVRVFEIPMVRSAHPIRDPVAFVRLVRLIRRERYDIVHGHSAKGGYLARLAARWVGGPKTVYHPRAFSYLSQRGPARGFFLQIERLAVPLTDLVIATSESERRRAMTEVGFAASRVVVVANSVDFGELEGLALANDKGPPVILTVGRFSYQKNPEMFVRVAALVVAQRPDIRFVWLGSGFAGPMERRVRDLMTRTGVGEIITVLPWAGRCEALEHIARCSVFVLMSRFEGMANTVLEAMALERPVVVTDVDGNRDVVTTGVSGYLVAPDDDGAMAARILALLSRPRVARELASVARERTRAAFDIRKNAGLLERVYEGVLQA